MSLAGRGLRHPLSLAGVVVTTASAVGFLAMAAAAALGWFDNPYAGLVIFVALPAIFLAGLLLVPAGLWLQARALRRDPARPADYPVIDLRLPRVRRAALVVAALTAVNIVIILLAGYGTLHWMESPAFCGQTCHTPMHPQFTAWQSPPHANVACVQCHIGEGAQAFVHYKLAGVRQLVHVVTGNYPRPIPAHQAEMRPALETCGTCHVASRDLGRRARVIRAYADDEASSETVTDLLMEVGGPGRPTPSGRAIHWHADPAVRVEYVATDADRQTIPFVRVTNARGEVKEYVADGTTPEQLAAGRPRLMDCTDCHNAVAHRIAPTAAEAVDRAIADGQIDRRLPFARRESVRVLETSYASPEEAFRAIDRDLRAHAGTSRAALDDAALVRTIRQVQQLYGRNVFPVMKVTWGVYPDNRGHVTSNGCFRCHDDAHKARDGSTISGDCSYCHEQREGS